MTNLDAGKQALITGGADPLGIGYATACCLAETGFTVTVTGLTQPEIDRTPKHEQITSMQLDVTNTADVNALVAGFERLDVLVNCAGTADLTGAEFEPDIFANTININLTGALRASVAARPLLAARSGSIVNIASMYSTFGSNVIPGYAASKGGIVQLTKSLAQAWAPEGIRVNAIQPGWIMTGWAQKMWSVPGLSDALADRAQKAIAARTPMGRWGEPAECGDVIAFLCSQKARFVTGVVIPVDGGYLVAG